MEAGTGPGLVLVRGNVRVPFFSSFLRGRCCIGLAICLKSCLHWNSAISRLLLFENVPLFPSGSCWFCEGLFRSGKCLVIEIFFFFLPLPFWRNWDLLFWPWRCCKRSFFFPSKNSFFLLSQVWAGGKSVLWVLHNLWSKRTGQSPKTNLLNSVNTHKGYVASKNTL